LDHGPPVGKPAVGLDIAHFDGVVLAQDHLRGFLDRRFARDIKCSLLQNRMGYWDISDRIMQREVQIIDLNVVLKLLQQFSKQPAHTARAAY